MISVLHNTTAQVIEGGMHTLWLCTTNVSTGVGHLYVLYLVHQIFTAESHTGHVIAVFSAPNIY
jgi:hypothetical protein